MNWPAWSWGWAIEAEEYRRDPRVSCLRLSDKMFAQLWPWVPWGLR